MYDTSNYGQVPLSTLETLNNFARKGWQPGSFVESVLCNDLKGAVGNGDQHNLRALVDITIYMVNELPAGCQGSRERYESWMEKVIAERNEEQQS